MTIASVTRKSGPGTAWPTIHRHVDGGYVWTYCRSDDGGRGCGPDVAVDEDGCCVTCGRTALFYGREPAQPLALPGAGRVCTNCGVPWARHSMDGCDVHPPRPQHAEVVWYDDPEAVERALWCGIVPDDEIEDAVHGGLDAEGNPVEVTFRDVVESRRREGLAGFCDGERIHAWVRPDIDTPKIAWFFGHELAHLWGADAPGIAAQEEAGAELVGRIAAEAWRLTIEALNGGFEIACLPSGAFQAEIPDDDGGTTLISRDTLAAVREEIDRLTRTEKRRRSRPSEAVYLMTEDGLTPMEWRGFHAGTGELLVTMPNGKKQRWKVNRRGDWMVPAELADGSLLELDRAHTEAKARYMEARERLAEAIKEVAIEIPDCWEISRHPEELELAIRNKIREAVRRAKVRVAP